ncbi:BTAD domain-containing putative transcriptional regulator [Streptomyces sp. NPDC093970]|uniref:AfsR/SARP family transcriptional regulator n=1 Tax=Streptomyces sp. NPDC093970 TaxID=3155076 RepID=UPI00343AAFC8
MWRGTTPLDPGPAQQRTVLALLALCTGRPVVMSEICEVLWGERFPRTAVNIVHRHVSALRRLLEPGLRPREEGRWIHRTAGGYVLWAEEAVLDLAEFRQARSRAQQEARRGNLQEAVHILVRGLGLWHAPAVQGIVPDAESHPAFDALSREYVSAAKEAADWALRAGTAERVLEAVAQASGINRRDEALQACLMRLLTAAGNPGQALRTFHSARERLREELGVDPGPDLREAYVQALRADVPDHGVIREALPGAVPDRAPVPRESRTPVTLDPVVRPAQLPAGLAAFVGRRDELATMTDLLEGSDSHVVTTVSGMPGIGKTTLAVHLAHRLKDRFPDGQLHIDLRGFGPQDRATEPQEALRFFLQSLGVPAHRIPAGTAERAALYRSLLAGRRILVLLDNARDATQVMPLLPGAAGCATIVTSRHPLSTLVATVGARPFILGVLQRAEALEVLAGRLGHARVSAEPEAANAMVDLCGCLPLGLAVVAARAATHPGWPLSAVADQLREADGSLGAFTGPEPAADVKTVFSWSYRTLSAGSADLFRLLSVHPGPDVTATAAAALTGRDVAAADSALSELARARLVSEYRPGRYVLHDLLGAYAAELSREAGTLSGAAPYYPRDRYVHCVRAEDRRPLSARDPIEPMTPISGSAPEPGTRDGCRTAARCTARKPVWSAVLRRAEAENRHDHRPDEGCFETTPRDGYLPEAVEGANSRRHRESNMAEVAVGISASRDDRQTYDRALVRRLDRVPAHVHLDTDGPLPGTARGGTGVRAITSSTRSPVTVRAGPGRLSSAGPASLGARTAFSTQPPRPDGPRGPCPLRRRLAPVVRQDHRDRRPPHACHGPRTLPGFPEDSGTPAGSRRPEAVMRRPRGTPEAVDGAVALSTAARPVRPTRQTGGPFGQESPGAAGPEAPGFLAWDGERDWPPRPSSRVRTACRRDP